MSSSPDTARPEAVQIADDDRGYHGRVIEQLRQVGALEAQRAECDRAIAAARAVVDSWSRYLTEKYGLGSQDRVDEAGQIIRSAPPNGTVE